MQGGRWREKSKETHGSTQEETDTIFTYTDRIKEITSFYMLNFAPVLIKSLCEIEVSSRGSRAILRYKGTCLKKLL